METIDQQKTMESKTPNGVHSSVVPSVSILRSRWFVSIGSIERRSMMSPTVSMTAGMTSNAAPLRSKMVKRSPRTTGPTGICWPVRALAEVFADVAFLGTNGLSVQRGLTTADQTEAATKHAMVQAARRTVVLADHTKIGTDHFAHVAGIQEVDTIITDAGLDDETAAEIEAAGPRVVRA
jgi:hypothetical protein